MKPTFFGVEIPSQSVLGLESKFGFDSHNKDKLRKDWLWVDISWKKDQLNNKKPNNNAIVYRHKSMTYNDVSIDRDRLHKDRFSNSLE